MDHQEISQRARQRMESPHFLDTAVELAKFKQVQRPGSFHFDYISSNQAVRISFFGLIDQNETTRPILAMKYATELNGPGLAFLDTLVEFCQKTTVPGLTRLSKREIENYLRDNNITPAFSGNTNWMFPIFESVQKLQKHLNELDMQNSGDGSQRKSPILSQDYRPEKWEVKAFDSKVLGPFSEINKRQQFDVIETIFDRFIRPYLQRDQGGVEIVYVDGPLVAINYTGACQSCDYCLTSTLDYIQRVVRLETQTPQLLVMTDS